MHVWCCEQYCCQDHPFKNKNLCTEGHPAFVQMEIVFNRDPERCVELKWLEALKPKPRRAGEHECDLQAALVGGDSSKGTSPDHNKRKWSHQSKK